MTDRICKACGDPITNSYVTALDADWHPEHFCCAVCQKPVSDARFYVHEEMPCHVDCFEQNIAPRCTLCDKPLKGMYQTNYWEERYCEHHADELIPCNFCGRLVRDATKRDRRRSVEKISCDVCASTAIERSDQAKELAPDLIDWLGQQGVSLTKTKFKIEVVDRAEFLSRKGGRHDPLGLTSSTKFSVNNRFDHAKIDGVAFLTGMPTTLFKGVCVHELGHVWLLQRGVVELPIVEEEGFCELLSYRHYIASGGHADLFYARNIERNRDAVYGTGFRQLKALEERVGFAQIVKSLKRKKKLPL